MKKMVIVGVAAFVSGAGVGYLVSKSQLEKYWLERLDLAEQELDICEKEKAQLSSLSQNPLEYEEDILSVYNTTSTEIDDTNEEVPTEHDTVAYHKISKREAEKPSINEVIASMEAPVEKHYVTSRHSGRYPWGSDENPYQSASELKSEPPIDNSDPSIFAIDAQTYRDFIFNGEPALEFMYFLGEDVLIDLESNELLMEVDRVVGDHISLEDEFENDLNGNLYLNKLGDDGSTLLLHITATDESLESYLRVGNDRD